MDLKRNVKYMVESSYQNPKRRKDYTFIEYFFNKNGMINKRIKFSDSKYKFFEGYQIYEYDEDNNIINSSTYSLNDQLRFTLEFEYNSKKDIIEIRFYNLEKEIYYYTDYEYSKVLDDAVLITEKKYNSENELINHSDKILNSNDEIIKSNIYGLNNKLNYYKSVYNQNGKLTKTIAYNSSNNIQWTQMKKYDLNGLMSEQSLISIDSITNHNWIVNYEFDKRNNWTKRYFIEGKDTTNYTERKIEYYK